MRRAAAARVYLSVSCGSPPTVSAARSFARLGSMVFADEIPALRARARRSVPDDRHVRFRVARHRSRAARLPTPDPATTRCPCRRPDATARLIDLTPTSIGSRMAPPQRPFNGPCPVQGKCDRVTAIRRGRRGDAPTGPSTPAIPRVFRPPPRSRCAGSTRARGHDARECPRSHQKAFRRGESDHFGFDLPASAGVDPATSLRRRFAPTLSKFIPTSGSGPSTTEVRQRHGSRACAREAAQTVGIEKCGGVLAPAPGCDVRRSVPMSSSRIAASRVSRRASMREVGGGYLTSAGAPYGIARRWVTGRARFGGREILYRTTERIFG